MRIGSDARKELFCRGVVQSRVRYDPQTLPRPDRVGMALAALGAWGSRPIAETGTA